jgi:hypothetical protein
MRSIIVAFVFVAAFAGAPQAASAQSPNSYQWCGKNYTRGTPTSCYYASKELCMATVSGIGGICYPNPGYRGAAVLPRYYGAVVQPRHHRYRRT